MSIKSVRDDEVEMDVDVEVENPNDEALHLVDIDFLFEDVPSDHGASQVPERRMIVKNVKRSCLVPAKTSEIIKVPIQLVYRDMKPGDGKGEHPPSKTGHAGAIIPFTLRANVNCWEKLHGMFQITIAKIKQFLTIASIGGGGRLHSFNPPLAILNGMHVFEATDSDVKTILEFRARNNNPSPIQLLHTNVSIGSPDGTSVYLGTKVENNITLRASSSRKISVPATIQVKQLLEMYEALRPGSLVPCMVRMEFWFRDSYYGTYKVNAEKAFEFPLPVKPEVKIERITFGVVEEETKRPVAKMSLRISSKNEFDFNITTLGYTIEHDSVPIATMSSGIDANHPLVMDANGEAIVEVVVEEHDPSFGSAIWKIFAGDLSTYKVHFLLEGNSAKFGRILFP